MSLNNNLVNASLVLGFSSVILIMVVVVLPEWRVNSVVASQPNAFPIRYKEGLWIRCTSLQFNYFSCDMYDTAILGLAVYLNAFRALMIIALLASVSGLACSTLGMRCATVIDEDSKAKRWVAMVGGMCHIAAGALTGICVTWYASEIVRQFNNPFHQEQFLRYTFGICLYLGWVAMVISILTGILMTCCTCFNKPADSQDGHKYIYEPTVTHEKANYSPPVIEKTIRSGSITSRGEHGSPRPIHYSSHHSYHHPHRSSPHSFHHLRDERTSSLSSTRSHHSHHSHRSHRHDSPKSHHNNRDSDIAQTHGFV